MLSPQRRNFWILLTVIAVFITAAQMFKSSHSKTICEYPGSSSLDTSCSMKYRFDSREQPSNSQDTEINRTEPKHKGCNYKTFTVPMNEK